jgi:hypothetical protein
MGRKKKTEIKEVQDEVEIEQSQEEAEQTNEILQEISEDASPEEETQEGSQTEPDDEVTVISTNPLLKGKTRVIKKSELARYQGNHWKLK